jgi:hypothetical protein
MLWSRSAAIVRFLDRFGPAILLSAVLALAIVGATAAVRLTHRPALAAQPVDPAILHAHRQQWRDDAPLP